MTPHVCNWVNKVPDGGTPIAFTSLSALYGRHEVDITVNRDTSDAQHRAGIVQGQVRVGEVFLNSNGRVDKFQEKPQSQSGWINGGFFVFSPKIFKYIKDDSIMLEREPLEKLVQEEQLMGYTHKGFWQCMDTIRDRDFLRNKWNNKEIPWLK